MNEIAPHPDGRGRPEDEVSPQECRAIRALDRDDDYTRSEIAFLLESGVDTVARHADRECHHNRLLPDDGEQTTQWCDYSDGELLDAFRVVYDRQPYQRMSKAVYEEYRPDDYPAAGTILKRFGSWPEAREAAHGES
jgi:hypothetical protein